MSAKAKKPFKSKSSTTSSIFSSSNNNNKIVNVIATPIVVNQQPSKNSISKNNPIDKYLATLGIEDRPNDLTEFCNKLFKKCSTDRDKQFVENYLSALLKKHIGSDSLFTNDWENIPLPDLPSSWETTSNALKIQDNNESSSSLPKIPKLAKKRTSEEISNNSNVLSKPLSLILEKETNRIHQNNNPIALQQKKNEKMLKLVLEKREEIKKKKALLSKISAPAHKKFKPSSHKVAAGSFVGTMQTLEKQYLRTSNVLNPEDFRPYHILIQSLTFVVSKYEKGEANYEDYLCEQLKAIRQDLIVQGIENEFSVTVYETHARFALQNRDISEFNQCQTRLRDLYSKNLKGNQAEFLMYTILYLTLNNSTSELAKVLKTITIPKSNDYVKYALEFNSDFSFFNFNKIFNTLYHQAPALGKSLIDIFAEGMRKKAIRIMCQSHSPTTLEVNFVLKCIGLPNLMRKEKNNFLNKMGIQLSSDNNNLIDCKSTMQKYLEEENKSSV